MARGYLARMAAEAASRHLGGPLVPEEPTLAEFAAHVYDQTWRSVVAPESLTRFAVLALDAEHAAEMGRLRLADLYATADGLELIENVAFGFEGDRVVNVLQFETAAERECRRAAWKARAA